jgi:aminoglycoside 2'-N-acetyltransferase I
MTGLNGAPRLMIVADEVLPVEVKEQILVLARQEWPEDFAGANRLRDWIQPARCHPIHVALVDNGVLVSCATVVWKDLQHAGESYRAYGLSEVLTAPAERGRGYGRQVVDIATARIRSSDADIGLFTCPPLLSRFYAASGWVPMERAVLLGGPEGSGVPTRERVMMGFFSPRGRRARPLFESVPIDFDDVLW